MIRTQLPAARHDYRVSVGLTKHQAYELDELAKREFGGSMSAALRALAFPPPPPRPPVVVPEEFQRLHDAIAAVREHWLDWELERGGPKSQEELWDEVVLAAREVAATLDTYLPSFEPPPQRRRRLGAHSWRR